MFELLLQYYGPVQIHKTEVPESNYVAHSYMWLSNHPQNEAMYNISVHQLPQYYQPQQVPSIGWTALVMWYKLVDHL